LRRTEIIDRERRWARPAAFAAFGVLILFIAAIVIGSGAESADPDNEAEQLRVFADDSGTFIASSVLQGLSIALIAPPLLYLFRAAQARSERIRGALIGITVAGPLFFAAAVVLQTLAVDSVASDFVATNGSGCELSDNDCIENLVTDDGLYSVATGLSLAGRLGLAVGMVYTCLWAMRTGLLSRFLGTLGMAVGVATLLFGPVFAVVYVLGLGLVFIGAIPGGRPPAWEAGEAVPWPAPGERPRMPTREEEPVEGRAEEVFPDAAAGSESEERPEEQRPAAAPEPGSIAEEVERAAERRQKRKRRQ
jgi:hypothetical protein